MKYIINLLIIFLLLCSCDLNSHESQEVVDEDTKNRTKFYKMALRTPNAIDAKWESPSVLVVIFEQNSLEAEMKFGKDDNGNDNYEDKAYLMTLSNAILGNNMLAVPFCVKSIYPDGKQVGYECIGDNSDS